MKPKLLKINVRRHQLIADFNRDRAEHCPICLVSTGNPALSGRSQLLPTETDQKSLLLVSSDVFLGVRLGSTADFAGMAFLQINDSANAIRLAAQERPAVVFLDLDLPALAGWEATEQFLAEEKCPPLILLTGRTGQFDLDTAIHAGAIMDKSSGLSRLLEMVNGVLGQPDAERVDRQARQRLLVRWLRPYRWAASDKPSVGNWGINE
jgi:CheY-like chemotaxis protein